MSRTMRVDGKFGGSIDGTGGADLAGISDQGGGGRMSRLRRGLDHRGQPRPVPVAGGLPRTDPQGLRLGTAVAVAFARNPMTVATIANDRQARIAPVGASMISSSLQSASTCPRATPGIGPPGATPHPRRLGQAHRWDVPSRTAGRYFGFGPWGYLL
jgi:hypothetical protein